jgi:hypothetical protein
MSNIKKALDKATFGSRIAEDDTTLQKYFVETEQWRKILADEVDIVFGAKGSGKSALYSLLVARKEVLRLDKRTMFLAAENPRGTPAFRDLTVSPPISEEQFRSLWKLYFLSIAASYLRHHITSVKSSNETANKVFKILEKNNLLEPNANLKSRLKSVLDYVRKYFPTIEGSVKDPTTGMEYSGKITMSAPSVEDKGLGFCSLDELLDDLNYAYAEYKATTWLVLDRLDVAFTESSDLEGNALRSLFRTYLDMTALTNIRIKIFLRDDIWKKIVDNGFREASHVTRTLTLSWDHATLRNLLVKRLVSNPLICDLYSVDPLAIEASADLQGKFFDMIFPSQIDTGLRKPVTLDWMLSRTADGSKRTAPRELIHLLIEARDEQLKLLQLGNTEPINGKLFDKLAIKSALPAVSKIRYEQTLCAENPTLKEYLHKFEGKKTDQSISSLAKLWEVTDKKAVIIADSLVEAGFFECRRLRDRVSYVVPFIYRDALKLVQGAAT